VKDRLPLVLSALALVVSLTGVSAFAATQINGSTIRNHTITANKLTPNAITQLHGAEGPAGEAGEAGLPGAVGPQGVPGLSGAAGGFDPNKVAYVTGPTSSIAPGQTLVITANCTPGSKVVGGGYFSSINDVGATEPDVYGGTEWAVIVQNNTGIYVNSWAYAVCVSA
jgi:hypothetical protein